MEAPSRLPPTDSSAEPELFDADGAPKRSSDGYDAWRRQRHVSLSCLGRQTGLPLNHRVEVQLRDGVRLRGRLQLQEETLFVQPTDVGPLALRVDGVAFKATEIESCVRID